MLFIVLVFGIFVRQVESHVIMEPKKYGTEDVIFVIFPQLDVPASAYKTIGSETQEYCPLKLWIGIVENSRNGNHYEVSDVLGILDDINTEVYRRKQNSDQVKIVLGGHGLSGSLVQQFVSEYPDTVDGIILLGTHIMLDKQLLRLNVPAMTVIGNLDGLTKITTIATVYKKFLYEVKIDPDIKYRYPMVVLDGVNHGIFSGSQLPVHLLIQDISTDSDTKKLLQDILQPISLFLVYCTGEYGTNLLAHFDRYFQETGEMLEPLLKVGEITVNTEEYTTYWVKQSQLWLSGLKGPDSTRINIESYFTYQSAFPPAIYDAESKITIYLFSQFDTPIENINSNDIPSQIHARMFRRDKILKNLGLSINSTSKERTCKDLNYASYLVAYYRSAEKVRKRFDQRNPGILFHDDILLETESIWNEKDILIEREDRVLHVTSYAYVTDSEKDGGHIFCTLFPPIRAMEWIYYGIYK